MRAEPEESRLLGPQINQLLEDQAIILQHSDHTMSLVNRHGALESRLRAETEPRPTYLLAPAVEHLLHLPPGLWHMAFLHQGEIVGVLQGDLEFAIICLLQRA